MRRHQSLPCLFGLARIRPRNNSDSVKKIRRPESDLRADTVSSGAAITDVTNEFIKLYYIIFGNIFEIPSSASNSISCDIYLIHAMFYVFIQISSLQKVHKLLFKITVHTFTLIYQNVIVLRSITTRKFKTDDVLERMLIS